jgi:hypothetical protein
MKFYVNPQRGGYQASNGGSVTYTASNIDQLIEMVKYYHPSARFYRLGR